MSLVHHQHKVVPILKLKKSQVVRLVQLPALFHKLTVHVSGFDSNWMVEFSWLLNVAGEGMFCLLCQKYKHIVCSSRGTWTTPCISYRGDTVVQHAARNGVLINTLSMTVWCVREHKCAT